MTDMKINVIKLTDVELLRKANSFTTGKDSKMTLDTAYRYGHSPIRTQLFWVELTDIPLFVASQLVRSHVGVQFFQRSKRIDRGGESFAIECHDFGQRLDLLAEDCNPGLNDEEAERITEVLNDLEKEIKTFPNRFDRYAPTDLAFIINAEALINMAHKRLCTKASAETREVMICIREKVAGIDPALAGYLVPQCVYRGGICPEPKGCGKNIMSDDLIDKLYK
ncbi:MAG: FAD-dependent thymidylate synthase [Muribaculaceae bacterium]